MAFLKKLSVFKPVRSEKPKYCRYCGAALSLKKKNVGFDTQTGEPTRTLHMLICPNYTMWSYQHYKEAWEMPYVPE